MIQFLVELLAWAYFLTVKMASGFFIMLVGLACWGLIDGLVPSSLFIAQTYTLLVYCGLGVLIMARYIKHLVPRGYHPWR